jgi:hypothetical protein
LRKLAHLSLSDPSIAEGLDQRFRQAGLPISLLAGAAPDERRPFNEIPTGTDTAPFVPEQYRTRLEELSHRGTEADGIATGDDPTDATTLDRHVARIARLEVGREVPHEEVPVYLRCLRDMAPRELARRGLDSLAETADLMMHLATSSELTGESRVIVEGCLEFYRLRVTVQGILEAIAEAPPTLAGAAGVLLSAGGAESARVAVDWLKSGNDATAREHVGAALAAIDPAVFRDVVAPDLNTNRRLADALAGALPAVEPSRAIDLAFQLESNAAVEVRRRAPIAARDPADVEQARARPAARPGRHRSPGRARRAGGGRSTSEPGRDRSAPQVHPSPRDRQTAAAPGARGPRARRERT